MKRRLHKLSNPSLRAQVADAIRDAIIEGRFRPGERVPEQELAEQLGVSRTPVREAIRILEQQGLVEIRPKNGTYIANFDSEEVYNSLSVRATLEQLAVRQAIERLGPEEWHQLCQELQDVSDEMRHAAEQGDCVRLNELDIEWHTHLIDAARNQALSRTWRTTGLSFLVWSPERELYPLTRDKLPILYKRHEELLTILRSRQPEQCSEAIGNHLFVKLADIRDWPGDAVSGRASATEMEG